MRPEWQVNQEVRLNDGRIDISPMPVVTASLPAAGAAQ